MCLHVLRAARALARQYDDAFRSLGLTSGQFSLLMSLHRDKPATIGAVAMLLGMDRTTLTAYLKPLTRRGLVTILPGQGDRRVRLLALTPAGQRLLAAAIPEWRRTQADVAGRVPSAERLRSELAALAASEPRLAAHRSPKNSRGKCDSGVSLSSSRPRGRRSKQRS